MVLVSVVPLGTFQSQTGSITITYDTPFSPPRNEFQSQTGSITIRVEAIQRALTELFQSQTGSITIKVYTGITILLIRFNPKLVQLQFLTGPKSKQKKHCFNPKLVQLQLSKTSACLAASLKFQSQTGSITIFTRLKAKKMS